MMLWLFPLMVSAGNIPVWEVENFGRNDVMVPNKGWTGGYRADSWYARDGRAYPLTDDNINDVNFRAYGQGLASDNWLIRDADLEDVLVSVDWYTEDDDTIGLVTHNDGNGAAYILFVSEDSAPPPITSVSRGTLVLLRVERDGGVELGSRNVNMETYNSLSLEVDDGRLTAFFDDREAFSVTDGDPLPAGQAGMYSYDAGDGDDSDVAATGIWVDALDGDDDGVADDDDNCEDDANRGQEDRDGDGVGDACDEADTATGTTTGTGGGSGGSGGSTSGGSGSGGGSGGSGTSGGSGSGGSESGLDTGVRPLKEGTRLTACGCGGPGAPGLPGPAGLLLAALSGLLIRRRRD